MSVATSGAALPTVQARCVNEQLKSTPDGDPPTFIGGCGGDPLGFSLPRRSISALSSPSSQQLFTPFHASRPDDLVFIVFAHTPLPPPFYLSYPTS